MSFQVKNILFSLFWILSLLSFGQEAEFRRLTDSCNKYKNVSFIKTKLYADSALSIANLSGNKKTLAGAYNTLGNIYLDNGNYKKALDQFDIAEKYASISNARKTLGNISNNQALCEERLGNYKE